MECHNLLQLATIYGEHRGLTLATVSTYAAGSGDLFDRLESGHDITSRRAARIVQWFSDQWPIDLEWPWDIPRPPPSPESPAMIEAERAAAPDPADPLTALNEGGVIASPNAFVAALPVPVLRATYDQVIRQYADGKPRAHKNPQRGSVTALVLDRLVAAGDARFAERIERQQFNLELARKAGLAS